MAWTPTWEDISYDDTYRTANRFKQNQIRMAWMTQVAPQLYQGMPNTPQTQMALWNYTRQNVLPDKKPDEDEIIKPESLSMEQYALLENNPAFGKKPFAEQLEYRDIWLRRMAHQDGEFKTLTPEEQTKFAQDFMKRYPSGYGLGWAGNTVGMNYTKEQIMKDLDNPNTDKVLKQIGSYTEQFVSSAIDTATTLFTGPILFLSDLIGGQYNDLRAIVNEHQNFSDWYKYVSDATNPIPSFVGSLVGMIKGPFGGFEKILAGGFKTATKAGSIVPKLVAEAGLIEKLGTKVLGAGKVAPLAYQILGGATAGGVFGITQAMREGKPWDANILSDATFGVGFEVLTRYFGAVSQIKKALKKAGVSTSLKNLFNAPWKPGDMEWSPEFMKISKGDPRFAEIMGLDKAINKEGWVDQFYAHETTLGLRAEMRGVKLDITDTGAKILRKETGDIIYSVDGPKLQTLQKLSNKLDYLDEGFDSITPKKFSDVLASGKDMELRELDYVPEAGRKYILDYFNSHPGMAKGFDYTLDKAGDTSTIDKLYGVIRNNSTPKIVKYMESIGIDLSMIGGEAADRIKGVKAEIAGLKANLLQLSPKSAHFIVEKGTGKMLDAGGIPVVYLEHPLVKDPFFGKGIGVGSADKIREKLASMAKIYADESKAQDIIFKGKNVKLYHWGDNRVLQLKMKVAATDGTLVDTVLNFSSVRQAQEFMSLGTEAAIKKVYQNDKTLQHALIEYKKSLSRSAINRIKAEGDALPFQYLAKQAKDEGYFLAHSNGKYIIQDVRGDIGTIKLKVFNSMTEVSDWLKANDARDVLPNSVSIPQDVIDEFGLDVDAEEAFRPLKDLPTYEQKIKDHFTIRESLAYRLLPFDSAMELFNKHQIGADLRKAGMGPIDIRNILRKQSESKSVWTGKYKALIGDFSKGMSKDQAEEISRLMEAVDNMDHLSPNQLQMREAGHHFDLKKDVYDDLVKKYGPDKAQRMLAVSNQGREMFNHLFKELGIDSNKFITEYVPRMQMELNRRGVSMGQKVDLHVLIGKDMPSTEKEAFFRFLRGSDPKAIAWERNIFTLMNSYVEIAAKEKFTQPVLTEIAAMLKKVGGTVVNGKSPADRMAFAAYMTDLMRSEMNIHAPHEEVLKLAAQATFETLATKFNKPIKKGVADVVQKLLTAATGSYLAFRPWAVGKQLTQSLLVGAPFIGVNYWLDGMDEMMRPGSLQYLMKLGKIDLSNIPVGGGFMMKGSGLLEKAVDIGMKPFKWGDAVNRAITYYGMRARFRYHAGQLNKLGASYMNTFLTESGMKYFGRGQYAYMKKILDTKPLVDAVRTLEDHVSTLAMNKTQFLYEKFEHPSMFRSGMGRIFGTFGTWPVSYLSLMSDVVTSNTLNFGQKAKIFGETLAVTGALCSGFTMLGINSESMLPWNSVSFSGGPYYQMINDALGAISNDPDSGTRWRSFVKSIVGLVPFSGEASGVMQAIDAFQRGEQWEGILHLMSAPIVLENHPKPAKTPLSELEKQLIALGGEAGKFKESADLFFTGRKK